MVWREARYDRILHNAGYGKVEILCDKNVITNITVAK
jgi:hypothetical protein